MSASLTQFEDYTISGYVANFFQGTSMSSGPFPFGGAIYQICQRVRFTGTTNKALTMYKSVDDGITWNIVGSASQPVASSTSNHDPNIYAASAYFDSSNILQVCYEYSSDPFNFPNTKSFVLINFDFSTDTWSGVISTSSTFDNNSSGKGSSINMVRFPTADWFVTYKAHTTNVETYGLYTAGIWTFATLQSPSASQAEVLCASLGDSDRVHMLYMDSLTGPTRFPVSYLYFDLPATISALIPVETSPTWPANSGPGGLLTAQDENWFGLTIYNSGTGVKDLHAIGVIGASGIAPTISIVSLYSLPEPPNSELTFSQHPLIWQDSTSLYLFFGTNNDFNQQPGEFDSLGYFVKTGAGSWTGPTYIYQSPPDPKTVLPPMTLDTAIQNVGGTVLSGTIRAIAASYVPNAVYCGAQVYISVGPTELELDFALGFSDILPTGYELDFAFSIESDTASTRLVLAFALELDFPTPNVSPPIPGPTPTPGPPPRRCVPQT